MASNNPEGEEVSQVNKLLQIKDLAWSKQLEKAVSGFSYFGFPFIPNHVVPFVPFIPIPYLLRQGFKDTILSVWDASSILRNYEVRTGHVLTQEELDSGYLAQNLIDKDYDLTSSVSVCTLLTSTNRLQQS